ncbi:MAG TPA: hypothetical protein VK470_20305, partial [Bacteroidota bacterium]|nr:hypothetical protein [Bacteroidota bacterium]
MLKKSVTIISILFVLSLAGGTVSHAQVKFGGYMQNWFINQQNEVANKNLEQGVSGFRIRRARLNAKTELSDVFSVDSWFEFSDKD